MARKIAVTLINVSIDGNGSMMMYYCSEVQVLLERVQALEEALQREKAARYHVQKQIKELKQENNEIGATKGYNILTCE
jgi:hypothetical protein